MTYDIFLSISDWRKLEEQARKRGKQAFRPGTVANHDSHIRLYVAFTIYFRFTDFPAALTVVLAFGEFLLRSFTAVKSVQNTLSSLRRFHVDMKFSMAAFEAIEFDRWRRALVLTVRTVPNQAPPLPFQMLENLCMLASAMGPEGQTMSAFLSVAFHALARASTLLSRRVNEYDGTRLPTLGDVRKVGDRFDLLVKWDKTHQDASQAFAVPLLARTGSRACPVRALQGLLHRSAGLRRDSPCFATLLAGRGRGGTRIVPLTLTVARDWLRLLLRLSGHKSDAFTLHSLRRGGCTLAFAGGAAVGDLQALGGWKSDAVQLYHSQDDARARAARAILAGTTD